MDLSEISELAFLAELVAAVRKAAPSMPFYLAGATARDLLLHYAHGIDVGRQTRDVDLALAVESWEAFLQLRSVLIESGKFKAVENVLHSLCFDGWLEIDLIPFGAIERADRTIAWPPEGAFVMGVFGFREVYDSTLLVRLPKDEQIRMVSLPALAVLKLMAWQARRLTSPGKDAHDLALVMRCYLDAGNRERLGNDAAYLLDEPEFDYEEAGARLLGNDMAALLPASCQAQVAALLQQESDPSGSARLIGDMPVAPLLALRLLQSLTRGYLERMTP